MMISGVWVSSSGPEMLELIRQMCRLLLNLVTLAREIRVLAFEWFNLFVARQARYFA